MTTTLENEKTNNNNIINIDKIVQKEQDLENEERKLVI